MILQKKKMGKKYCSYKQCLDILDFSMIKEQLPLIAGIRYSKKESFPYFSAGLSEIANQSPRERK